VDNENTVRKGYHCTWQIHYHIVFPVKYRKSLLDEEVVQIVRETAAGTEERYEMEIETMSMDKNHIHLLCGAQKSRPTAVCRPWIRIGRDTRRDGP
jgi:putative transposase